MAERKILKMVRGRETVDGAGVHLVRVLSNRDVEDFDPFLMLDSFDSTDPGDYIAGFPMHPHRGIETITYLISGRIEHEDSLGNKGAIDAGKSQWMTAGSGILHQEMPKPSERMLGFQLWLNLPRTEKMTAPAYFDITPDRMGTAREGNAEIRVISGSFSGVSGVKPPHIPASLYDIRLPRGEKLDIVTPPEETVFVFSIVGQALIFGRTVPEKTAVLFGEGDRICVGAPPDSDSRVIFFSGKPLHEPVSWGGPIVMNTREELELAFQELEAGTFIKHP